MKKEFKHKASLAPHTVRKVITSLSNEQQAGWQITEFDIPALWEYTQGENVVVGIIDTGNPTHPDVVDNILPGKNFVSDEPFDDLNGHETHLCGIIAAEQNDFGILGIAPKCKIIPCKVLDKHGDGEMENVALGIRWLVEETNCDLISMSLGSPYPLQQVRKAIQLAVKKGVVIFCAAGNSNKNIFYPSCYPETVSVSAIDEHFNRASFSNKGEALDFMAPGVDIYSTYLNGNYVKMSGTSQSTPFVCALAALVLSYKRKMNLDISLNSSDDYINLLKQYTTAIVGLEENHALEGFGILDPRKLVEWFNSNSM